MIADPRSAAEWKKIEARHVKVEDVIYDGPVCRTCRDISGAAVPYPCDAAIALAHARQRVEAFRERAASLVDPPNELEPPYVRRARQQLAAAIRALPLEEAREP